MSVPQFLKTNGLAKNASESILHKEPWGDTFIIYIFPLKQSIFRLFCFMVANQMHIKANNTIKQKNMYV